MRPLPIPQDYILRALDRPARSALELSRRSIFYTLAPAILGLALLAGCAAIAGALARNAGAPRLDVLRASLESFAVVVPGAIVFATWLRIRVSPRMLAGAVAIGFLTAGIVCVSFVPLVLFLGVVSAEAPAVMQAAVALVPIACIGVSAATMLRVVDASDASRRAWLFSRGYSLLLLAVFALRVPEIVRVVTGGMS